MKECVCTALSCMLDVCHIHLCRSHCSQAILLCHVRRMKMSLALANRPVLSSWLLYSLHKRWRPKFAQIHCALNFSECEFTKVICSCGSVICNNYKNLTRKFLSWEKGFYFLIQYPRLVAFAMHKFCGNVGMAYVQNIGITLQFCSAFCTYSKALLAVSWR